MRSITGKAAVAAAALIGLCLFGAAAFADGDLGLDVQHLIESHSNQQFGVAQGLAESSHTSINQATATADPTKLVTLAKSLNARTVAVVDNAPNIDQMALWPNDTSPTHIIACNEQGAGQVALIRINLANGSSEVIVNGGLVSCDPVRRTPWGTIIFGEENGTSGRIFELVDPLHTTNVAISAINATPPSTPSGGTGAGNIAYRSALGNLSFEGLAGYPNGVVYFGDENRPGTGVPGGSYFKFIPSAPPGPTPVTNLANSPLVAGKVYGLRLGLRSPNDSGQGTQTGLGQWLDTSTAGFPNLRSAAVNLKLTAYYRPEDADIDTAALAAGKVRFCGNNTGNEGTATNGRTYGETICITDGTLAAAATPTSVAEVQFLVLGNPQFAMMDNIARQPATGNWLIHEDSDQLVGNNDLWDCADDGADADLLSDGCIRVGTLNDGVGNPQNSDGAEWTGGIFSGDGRHFYVSVQHNVSGKGVILDITGWNIGGRGNDGGGR